MTQREIDDATTITKLKLELAMSGNLKAAKRVDSLVTSKTTRTSKKGAQQ